MNSSLVAFITEIVGRVSLGDGVLELTVEDARDYLLVPDVRQFDEAARQKIEEAFQPLLTRPIGSVFEEITRPDRQALDSAILQAMGLQPAEWLPRIYDGLSTLVKERIQLGRMRSQSRRERPRKAARRVATEVLEDILPSGPRVFPDDFLPGSLQKEDFSELALPPTPLKHKGHYFGKEELTNDDGVTIHVSKFEARYILYAQASGQTIMRIPKRPVEVSRAVNAYAQYLRNLRKQLYSAYFTRTLDQAAAERFVNQVWNQFHLPDPDWRL